MDDLLIRNGTILDGTGAGRSRCTPDGGRCGHGPDAGSRGIRRAFLRPVFHGVRIEHEEVPIPGGHAIIHGEEKVEQVEAGMVLAIGNCGIYREHFGVRMEDTVWVREQGPVSLTRHLKALNVAGR